MKMVTLKLVEKPESWDGSVKFTQASYEAAAKRGPVTVPYVKALEAVKNSGGMYRIAPEKKALDVEVRGLAEPEDMTNEQLFQEMAAFGKPPQKKMKRQVAIDFVKKLRKDAVDLIIDDE